MKSKFNLCVIIFIFVASFSSISAETKNRFSAGVGFGSFNTIIYGSGFTATAIIDSELDKLDNKKEESTDEISAGILFNASYDRKVLEYLALGLNYNYEKINYIINYDDNDSSETDLNIHTIMPRITLIYGFKNLKIYHAFAIGIGIYDNTLIEKIDSQTIDEHKIVYDPAIHVTIVGLEYHLTEHIYAFMDAGIGFAGFANAGVGYMF
ncbi:MAG: hypothetical protein JXK07_09720 [Spirochaetes bacterium]|nr:hypothetical protein [Spirochaetota bacterium]MBN2769449.1 hypothetical protein [Spirochaetota bacterium]